jgi:hypothetical protein
MPITTGLRTLDGRLACFVGGGRRSEQVGGGGLDRQIRNYFVFGPEALCHGPEVLRTSLRPAEFCTQPRPELTVRQTLLDRQEVIPDPPPSPPASF